MNKAEMRAPWEFTKGVLALAPVANNAAQNGAAIDRTGYASIIVDIPFACSGTPTGGLLTAKLQDSADGTTFADFGSPVTAAIPGSGGALASLALDVAGARQFVRVVSPPPRPAVHPRWSRPQRRPGYTAPTACRRSESTTKLLV